MACSWHGKGGVWRSQARRGSEGGWGSKGNWKLGQQKRLQRLVRKVKRFVSWIKDNESLFWLRFHSEEELSWGIRGTRRKFGVKVGESLHVGNLPFSGSITIVVKVPYNN